MQHATHPKDNEEIIKTMEEAKLLENFQHIFHPRKVGHTEQS